VKKAGVVGLVEEHLKKRGRGRIRAGSKRGKEENEKLHMKMEIFLSYKLH
jgi:hypothetical protein